MDKNKQIEIINSFCGKDENGYINDQFVLLEELWKKDETQETINEIVINSAEINVAITGGHVFVSLTFKNNKDVDLIYLHNSINDFIKKYQLSEEQLPILSIILKRDNPLDYDTFNSYCVAWNPIGMGLFAHDTESFPNEFQFTFDEENFLFYELENGDENILFEDKNTEDNEEEIEEYEDEIEDIYDYNDDDRFREDNDGGFYNEETY